MELKEGFAGAPDRDVTLPLLAAGFASAFLCVCLCVALVYNKDYLNSRMAPVLGRLMPTPTPPPCPDVPQGWAVTLNEKFYSNLNDWPLGTYRDPLADTEIRITRGILQYDIEAKQGVYFFVYPVDQNEVLMDFYLKANVRQVSGPMDNDYGLVFRMIGPRHYYFSINNLQEVSIHRRSNSGWDETPFTGISTAVRPGESNEMAVLGRGSHFVFCVNQQVVTEFDNPNYAVGKVGVAISPRHAGDVVVVEFDDLTVYAPEK